MALQFLSFFELPKDERPKREIWLDPKRLEEHFIAVEKRREEKYGGKGTNKEVEDPVENQAADLLIVGDE